MRIRLLWCGNVVVDHPQHVALRLIAAGQALAVDGDAAHVAEREIALQDKANKGEPLTPKVLESEKPKRTPKPRTKARRK